MNGYRTKPKDFDKITKQAISMIDDYLDQCKKILPKPLLRKERNKLNKICREAKLTSKHLSGFLSLIKQNTELRIEE